MLHLLDNPIYNALISGNKTFARGNDRIKYFPEDISPFAGLLENSQSDLNVLYQISPAKSFFILFSSKHQETDDICNHIFVECRLTYFIYYFLRRKKIWFFLSSQVFSKVFQNVCVKNVQFDIIWKIWFGSRNEPFFQWIYHKKRTTVHLFYLYNIILQIFLKGIEIKLFVLLLKITFKKCIKRRGKHNFFSILWIAVLLTIFDWLSKSDIR